VRVSEEENTVDSMRVVAVKGAVSNVSYQNWDILKLGTCRKMTYLQFLGSHNSLKRGDRRPKISVFRGWVSSFETEFPSAKIGNSNQVPV
jgi:hypothetical protein